LDDQERPFPDIAEARKNLALWQGKQKSIIPQLSAIRMRQIERQRENSPADPGDESELARLNKESAEYQQQIDFYKRRIVELRIAHQLQ
jgi:hypothetical protein